MAKRWIDGPGIYSHGWDEATRDVFVWLFSVGADTCGMQREQPARVAEDTNRSLRRVKTAISELIDDGTLVRYRANGRGYLALVNWQDIQQISYAGKHTCPPVPAEQFAKLSEATRERAAKMLRRQLAKSSQDGSQEVPESYQPPPTTPPSCALHGKPATSQEAGRSRPCGWCQKPVDPGDERQPEVKRLVQLYHDRYRQRHGVCPSMGGGKDFAAVKRQLAQHEFSEIGRVIAHGVASEDAYLRKRGYPLCDLMSNYDGIALALRAGQPHGGKDATRRSAPVDYNQRLVDPPSQRKVSGEQ